MKAQLISKRYEKEAPARMKAAPAKSNQVVAEVSRKKLYFSRSHQVKDEFLHPTGFLCRRLDTTVYHWPIEVPSHDVFCHICR